MKSTAIKTLGAWKKLVFDWKEKLLTEKGDKKDA